jgi:hypothetical protein
MCTFRNVQVQHHTSHAPNVSITFYSLNLVPICWWIHPLIISITYKFLKTTFSSVSKLNVFAVGKSTSNNESQPQTSTGWPTIEANSSHPKQFLLQLRWHAVTGVNQSNPTLANSTMSFVPAGIKIDPCPLTQRFVWKQHPRSSPDGIDSSGR